MADLSKQSFERSFESEQVDLGNLKDLELWDEFREGKESAFIQIYNGYFDLLYRYGIRLVGDDVMVEDAIQDLFVTLRSSRHRLGRTNSIKFYLYKCLKHNLLREIGKWKSKRDEFPPPNYFEFSLSQEERMINRQLEEEKVIKLNQAISEMSPRKREIIYYSFYEGMDYRQIQELMGFDSLKTTRNLMYKAIGFLKEVLER